MPGLPKIALARLKAKPGAPKSAIPPSGPEACQGAEHLDANLLAAFAERTLTERERTQVLSHLTQCAECREVAAFALPAEVVAAEPSHVAAGRRWGLWPVLRWGAVAAVLGALSIVVVLHPGMRKRHAEIAKMTPPPAPAANIASAPQAVSPPAPAPPAAQAKVQAEMQDSAGELAISKKARGPNRDMALRNHGARAQAKPQVTLMASSRPPATFRAGNVPVVKAEREESKAGNELTAGVPSENSPPPAPAGAPMATSEDAAKAGAEVQAGAAGGRATTQSAAVLGGNIGAGSAEVAPAKAAPRVSAEGAVHMTAQAPMAKMQARQKEMEYRAGPPAALWSVSANGKAQRSTDGGKTFEQIHVAHGIKFRAIAALGNDVWTGGTGGALFHSVDGGATWTRAGLNFEGNAITETITGIQLHDPQHLTVTTATGSQWVSEDGGQHWQKQP